jgi:hypothetical protein
MFSTTTGGGSVAIGAFSPLGANTTGTGHVAVGNATLANNHTGIQNTAVGGLALLSTVSGSGSTGVGRQALQQTSSEIATFTTTGGSGYTDGTYTGINLYPNYSYFFSQAVATLVVSGGVVTTVTLTNNGIGMRVGATASFDSGEVPAGLQAGSGFFITIDTVNTGSQNTALGWQAGRYNITGSRNLFLGYSAGINETSSDNLYISNTNTSTPLIKGKFDSAGGNAGSVRIYGDLQLTTKTPASASATGTVGTITYDNDYIYICIATDTWKRVAISTW